MRHKGPNLMTAALAVSLIFFCTCCAGASVSSPKVEEPDEETVAEVEDIEQMGEFDGQEATKDERVGQAEVDNMKETIRRAMEEQGYSEAQTENVLITITDTLPGIVINRAEPIVDEVGKGVMITEEKGEMYNVYINKRGNVFGIKELKTGEYIFSTYE